MATLTDVLNFNFLSSITFVDFKSESFADRQSVVVASVPNETSCKTPSCAV